MSGNGGGRGVDGDNYSRSPLLSGSFANFPNTHEGQHHLSERQQMISSSASNPSASYENLRDLEEKSGSMRNSPIVGFRSGLSALRGGGGTDIKASDLNVGVDDSNRSNIQPLDPTKWMRRSEVFVFDFGVVVLWNFSEEEELTYLSTLRRFATNPTEPDESEIEDFHFQYDLTGPFQPRIFNDMIT
jgi:uncharacterized Rmd1/YagE family protein